MRREIQEYIYINIQKGKKSICVTFFNRIFRKGRKNNKHKQTYITMTTSWRKKREIEKKNFF